MELFDNLLDEITHSGCKDLEAGCFRPLISYIRARRMGKITPPYIPQWDLMPLPNLCRLALLWKSVGFEKEAGELAYLLNQFKLDAPLLSLWCPEKEYNEKEGLYWFSRLSEIDPVACISDFSPTFFHFPSMTAAFTQVGFGTSLGVIRMGDVEIRALGPQSSNLNFGIQGRGMDGWTRTFAYPEVWLETKAACRDGECKLDVKFIGLMPETPLEFAFYVKAASCQIGNEILKPKSLRRYNGEASEVIFGKLKIESPFAHKVQVIPLAGEGCFWDCEFLLSFEIHPFFPQISLTFTY